MRRVGVGWHGGHCAGITTYNALRNNWV